MRHSLIEYVESKHTRKDLTEFRTGDTVRVHWKVKEGEKERVQPFEGVVIRKTRGYNRSTFTVRKMSYGVGVERIFPLHSPRYERVEVLTRGAVRRNRLFYLRDLQGKASRVDTQESDMGSEGGATSAAQGSVASAAPQAPVAEPSTDAPAAQAAPAKAEKKPAKAAKKAE
jgi:large subunit ribosomal protein L19